MRPSSLIATTEHGLGPSPRWWCRTHHFRCILEAWWVHGVLLALPLLMNFSLLASITWRHLPPLPIYPLARPIWLYSHHPYPLARSLVYRSPSLLSLSALTCLHTSCTGPMTTNSCTFTSSSSSSDSTWCSWWFIDLAAAKDCWAAFTRWCVGEFKLWRWWWWMLRRVEVPRGGC